MEADEMALASMRASEFHGQISNAIEGLMMPHGDALTQFSGMMQQQPAGSMGSASSSSISHSSSSMRKEVQAAEERSEAARRLVAVRDALEELEDALLLLQEAAALQGTDVSSSHRRRKSVMAAVDNLRKLLLECVVNRRGRAWERLIDDMLDFVNVGPQHLALPPYAQPTASTLPSASRSSNSSSTRHSTISHNGVSRGGQGPISAGNSTPRSDAKHERGSATGSSSSRAAGEGGGLADSKSEREEVNVGWSQEQEPEEVGGPFEDDRRPEEVWSDQGGSSASKVESMLEQMLGQRQGANDHGDSGKSSGPEEQDGTGQAPVAYSEDASESQRPASGNDSAHGRDQEGAGPLENERRRQERETFLSRLKWLMAFSKPVAMMTAVGAVLALVWKTQGGSGLGSRGKKLCAEFVDNVPGSPLQKEQRVGLELEVSSATNADEALAVGCLPSQARSSKRNASDYPKAPYFLGDYFPQEGASHIHKQQGKEKAIDVFYGRG